MSDAGFPIVGIGVSAGGVEALKGFFLGLPPSPGIALVVVSHLSPDRDSLLHEIIARYTSLPVHDAEDQLRLAPDNVYVLPANALLGIEQGRLRVSRLERGRRERKPVDVFFSALAVDQGELAAGVVLSGGDGDGTLGIKAIKQHGGLTLAQAADGYGPQHPEMPASAIATGMVDLAIPAGDMGVRLAEFARSAQLFDQPGDAADAAAAHSLEQARPEIYAILHSQVGHDFSGYKTRTFLRRVQRRMRMLPLDSVEAYVAQLRQDPQEVAALFRDLLINVTSFFRDAEAFERLAAEVIPRLFERGGTDDTLRVWVPGCSTGEEVYSIAILLREYIDQHAAARRIQIFATDIDERALAVARAARYPAPLLDSVSPARRQRFFVPDAASFVLAKDVRDMCVFSPHSLIRDPPFSHMDLISCRNLLIYFGPGVQDQVIPTFHYALRPGGYLFLGTAENVSHFSDLFTAVDRQHRIFRRRADSTLGLRLPLALEALRGRGGGELAARRPPPGPVALRQVVDSQVMERFAPPHVVINRDGDIVYFSHRTGKYLEAAPGLPTRQLLTLARRGLRLTLRSLFREVLDSGRPAMRDGISVEGEDGRVQVMKLVMEPLSQAEGSPEPLYLVLFLDDGPVMAAAEALDRARLSQAGGAEQVERDLRETRERLQSLIEEYETALEELKSSNEELVSVNEELQSANEELEASKEELVSLNEELHTVNAELIGKVEELDRANGDLQNLFDSTDIATVFLDSKLLIRSFTPAATQVFNIRPTDRGRPITDLASRFSLPGFPEDIARVLASGEKLERTEQNAQGGAHFLIRLTPYRGADRQTSGVVVSFLDVTGLTRAEERQRLLIAELQHRTRNLLAVVQSIAQQTLGKGGTLVAFRDRLAALGRVQGLISDAGAHVDLEAIVGGELAAFGASNSRISAEGPAVPVRREAAQTLALALHELATNALKHGALKDEHGRLAVRWLVEPRADGAHWLVLTWRESGVAMPPGPSPRGFGRQLIEQALAYGLGARSDLQFGADGVSCRIELPLAPASGGKPESAA